MNEDQQQQTKKKQEQRKQQQASTTAETNPTAAAAAASSAATTVGGSLINLNALITQQQQQQPIQGYRLLTPAEVRALVLEHQQQQQQQQQKQNQPSNPENEITEIIQQQQQQQQLKQQQHQQQLKQQQQLSEDRDMDASTGSRRRDHKRKHQQDPHHGDKSPVRRNSSSVAGPHRDKDEVGLTANAFTSTRPKKIKLVDIDRDEAWFRQRKSGSSGTSAGTSAPLKDHHHLSPERSATRQQRQQPNPRSSDMQVNAVLSVLFGMSSAGSQQATPLARVTLTMQQIKEVVDAAIPQTAQRQLSRQVTIMEGQKGEIDALKVKAQQQSDELAQLKRKVAMAANEAVAGPDSFREQLEEIQIVNEQAIRAYMRATVHSLDALKKGTGRED